MKIEWTKTTTGTCESLDELPADAEITYVDDKPCMGICEGCYENGQITPILEGDKFLLDAEAGFYFCENCAESLEE